MTKKDYQKLATALYLAKPDPVAVPGDSQDIVDQWRVDVDRVAGALAEDSPRFDRETFIAACEDGNVGRRPKRKTAKHTSASEHYVECGSCSQYRRAWPDTREEN